MKRIFFSLCFLMLFDFSSWNALQAADRDDIYLEAALGLSLNNDSRQHASVWAGYCPWNEWGLGLFYDHYFDDASRDVFLRNRAGAEIRWFQEPFEFSVDLGLLRWVDSQSLDRLQPAVGVGAGYLWALTPSMAAQARFSFLFMEGPQVLFFGGLGARILY